MGDRRTEYVSVERQAEARVVYNFGVYHWRRRVRSALSAVGVSVAAALLGWRSSSRAVRVVATVATIAALVRVTRVVSRALSPPPWALERYKYDALAARLPTERATHVLDVGCGTGRSLVGLAPHLPTSCVVVGLDVFDDRVIFGNAPGLARRNGSRANIDVTPLVGDAARLPVATESQDLVTMCRVLHDLPQEAIDPALRDARRVCAPNGVLGILELPIVPGKIDRDPEEYWRERVLAAGFEIRTLDRVDRRGHDEPYIVIAAAPVR